MGGAGADNEVDVLARSPFVALAILTAGRGLGLML